jgi:hypothetical protein
MNSSTPVCEGTVLFEWFVLSRIEGFLFIVACSSDYECGQ